MTVGSLFSGIGGIDLGLECAGMTIRWQVENDNYATKVLAKHWPNIMRYDDIYNVNAESLEPVDLICGGVPCQPFSVAGKQLGASDERYLWPEMLRVVRTIMPTYCLIENVSGLAAKGGVELERMCRELEAYGFEVFPPLDVPSCAFGLRTMERHLWIIATAPSKRCERSQAAKNADNGNARQLPRTDSRDDRRWDLPESRVYRTRKGIPYLVDRNRALGNAVPPPMAQWIGALILKLDGVRRAIENSSAVR